MYTLIKQTCFKTGTGCKNICMLLFYSQVELYTDLERKMPASLLSKLDRMTQKIYPNKSENTLHNVRIVVLHPTRHAHSTEVGCW